MSEVIAAIATPTGEGGISIIRFSGLDSLSVALKLFCSPNGKPLESLSPHKTHFGSIYDPTTRTCVDEVILTWFKAPKSYTGEDVIEISAHGGIFVSSRILGLVLDHGARLAEPGEFTRRAFMNSRIDLSQAEAVADLISAASDKALQAAIMQLKGGLSKKITRLYNRLLFVLSQIEAAIDFPEEGLDFQKRETSISELKQVHEEISDLINTYKEGKISREGASVSLVGKPNVGKSSLLNALLKEDRAIVTPLPGTTRDTLEEKIRIKDSHINIIDSAGLRNHPEIIEQEGIRRTRSAIENSDLNLVIFDRSQPLDENDDLICNEVHNKPKLIIINKCDLQERWSIEDLKKKIKSNIFLIISAKEQSGLDSLIDAIYSRTINQEKDGQSVFISRERHRLNLVQASASLEKTLASLGSQLSEEFVAIDLIVAINHLAIIIGKSVEGELLDQIFNSFCIGK
ncbi:MAG: tRNA uridine-5-carboxymethylaminomethyl(34) synthesis GTPase MnmE [Nitrospina sp.]|nr:tRNA uridine-5-carboxymethylaminomethyl(34) synthesis GTPase MnmE [Nitrospina sp.]